MSIPEFVVMFVLIGQAITIAYLTYVILHVNKRLGETRERSSRLIAGLWKDIYDLRRKSQVQEYEALEKGMDEQQESFEQEYLTWQEKEFDYMWELAHVMNALYDAEHGIDEYS